jgi:hypothetical protein
MKAMAFSELPINLNITTACRLSVDHIQRIWYMIHALFMAVVVKTIPYIEAFHTWHRRLGNPATGPLSDRVSPLSRDRLDLKIL